MSAFNSPRILAIAPGVQHLGLAVFEGHDLLRFGVKSFEGRKREQKFLARAEQYLDRIVAAYQPDILVLEEPFYAQARLSPLLRSLIRDLKRWARRNGLRTTCYLPTTVKERLLIGKKTRKALADEMVRRYWFLYQYQKPGRTHRYWQQMFDAVALGLVASEDRSSSAPPRRRSTR